MDFSIVDDIIEIETFAVGKQIHELARLRKSYGRGRWRKRKGIAQVQLEDGAVRKAEIHGYEASKHWQKGVQDQTLP